MKPIHTIVIVVAGSVIGVLAFIAFPELLKPRMDPKIFELSYEFLLVTVIGGVVSLVYKQFEAERAQREKQLEMERVRRDAERKLRADLHADVVRAYNSAKKIRRVLRATAIERSPDAADPRVHPGPYNEQMQALIDTQLDFEAFVHRVRSNPTLYAAAPSLKAALTRVEDYLSKIVTEYEGSFGVFKTYVGSPPLSQFPRLSDLVGPYENSLFSAEFKQPFLSAISDLESRISNPDAVQDEPRA
jgi:hypothetical protein